MFGNVYIQYIFISLWHFVFNINTNTCSTYMVNNGIHVRSNIFAFTQSEITKNTFLIFVNSKNIMDTLILCTHCSLGNRVE